MQKLRVICATTKINFNLLQHDQCGCKNPALYVVMLTKFWKSHCILMRCLNNIKLLNVSYIYAMKSSKTYAQPASQI